MKISIITVCFNSEKTILDTINSVSSQIYDDIEYIIVDGNSSDLTVQIINSNFNRVSKFVSETDCGIYDAMNKGIGLATGDVIGFLNSDDIFFDSMVIKIIAETFLRIPELDAVYGDLLMVSPKNLNTIIRYWRPGVYRVGMCKKGWIPPHPTFYVKRSKLLSAEGFDLRYRLQSDVDLMLRLFEIMRISSLYLPQILIKQRFGGATTGHPLNIIRGNIEALLSYRRNNLGSGIGFIFYKIFSRFNQFLRRPYN